ncbi:hydroxyacid dehydrogenase [Streptomonospora algeriensis]|uniref:Hydroxyacid dehydrogenase n=1 Tax=Streptomonospora algeriensis TaxID=995084 RepID=A0ABW3BEJ9_9ACTN
MIYNTVKIRQRPERTGDPTHGTSKGQAVMSLGGGTAHDLPRPGRGPGARPRTLLAMDRRTFDLQCAPAVLDHLQNSAELGEPLRDGAFEDPGARARLAGCEVLLTSWGCPPITEDVLADAPRLRAVLHGAGSVRGHVPPALLDRGIRVTTSAAADAVPVAEYTPAMLLACGKRVPFLVHDARAFRSRWSYTSARGPLSNRGRTVCLIGWSRVGRLLGRLLAPFDLEVLVLAPCADAEQVAACGARLTTAQDTYPRTDVLSLHAPLLPTTRRMIDAAALAQLSDGATVINTARGGLVDTAALERECRTGRLYAVLDVTGPEPLPDDSVLYDCENVVITPHIAGSPDSETERMAIAALDELDRFRTGQPAEHPITPDTYEVTA